MVFNYSKKATELLPSDENIKKFYNEIKDINEKVFNQRLASFKEEMKQEMKLEKLENEEKFNNLNQRNKKLTEMLTLT